MPANAPTQPLIDDEIDVLADLVPLGGQRIIELGCGGAQLARALLARHPDSHVTGLEVDERQHAKNLAAPQAGLTFVAAGAQAIPCADASFDLALMLKSLHHVPLPSLSRALGEVARVLRPGGHLYVSEPVYGGAFNEVIRVFNDEGVVRAAAQAALDEALRTGAWRQVAERRFEMPVRFRGLRRVRTAHDAADLRRPPHRRCQARRGACRLRAAHGPRRRTLRPPDARAPAAPAGLTGLRAGRRVTCLERFRSWRPPRRCA